MTNETITQKQLSERVQIYAQSYLSALDETLNRFYGSTLEELQTLGGEIKLPLYHKKIGKDLFLAVFQSDRDFFLFFTNPKIGKHITYNAIGDPKFDEDWSAAFPQNKKYDSILSLLEIQRPDILDEVSVGGTTFLSLDDVSLKNNGKSHGRSKGQYYGSLAEIDIVDRRREKQVNDIRASFRTRYLAMKENKKTPQKRGYDFEALWREVLNHYGWNTRKTKRRGEENDFTAMFGSQLILGEVRWELQPITADQVRAFVAKLIPRTHSVGLMIALAGYDEGAMQTAREHVKAGNAIVMFDTRYIESIILEEKDPGELFQLELRNVYDFLYEDKKDA